MKVLDTPLPGLKLIETPVFHDDRGFFLETFRASQYASALGPDVDFVQDNCSYSHHGVLRGMHYQVKHPQGKLVRVVQGQVFDVVVDMRPASPTFGRWHGLTMTACPTRKSANIDGSDAHDAHDTQATPATPATQVTQVTQVAPVAPATQAAPASAQPYVETQLWIPPGFAHGFLVLSDHAMVEYKCSQPYRPDDEACLKWDDEEVGIAWPPCQPILSAKDQRGLSLTTLRKTGRLP
ncbi:dTDP-4-dehydrorhamnose 3,5-epimerase family protein [Allopusillimonas ginsengisoli]|uniref:dTDP-4-dehydrorhamnose 3,5-epimerase family protein n=1 Tax=Allopusillimonas ginsengisoli TaxID=453575 RepID=UPI0039C479B5